MRSRLSRILRGRAAPPPPAPLDPPPGTALKERLPAPLPRPQPSAAAQEPSPAALTPEPEPEPESEPESEPDLAPEDALDPEPDLAPALPAGIDPVEAATRGPGTRERGRIRRRLRYLVRLREIHLRDLGGLVFDIHRFGARADARDRARHAGLVRAKVAELDALDSELRALDGALGGGQGGRELREAGIGGACERCGALHGSDARFCSACGAPVGRGAERASAGNGVPGPVDRLDVGDGPER